MLPLPALAQTEILDKEQSQTIIISNEISAEVLRVYNDQAELVTEMRLKMQELEQQLYYATERITNLEAEVWELKKIDSRPKSAEAR
ncbi:MAG: hypothetical protein OET90_04865 [Desulfuromonadales bacterium]|nr:hypothetical protein [Desulfuromonadales bacterium]